MASIRAADLFNVNGMVFVVTGGGTGIGRMMAEALDTNGALKVFILGRRLEKLQEVASQATNKSIVPIQCDVTSKEALATAATQVKEEVGFINACIANSGITGPTLQGVKQGATLDELQQFLWNSQMDEYNKTYELNITAALFTLYAFLPLLDAGNNSGSSPTASTGIKSQFICTSSIAAFNRKATAGIGYGSSKAGLNHSMKMMANLLAPYHIRVNVFAPGMYPSEMHDQLHVGESSEPKLKEGGMPAEVIPATRMGSAQDIAGNILYLCSRGGAYCNGNIAVADGGRLSIMPGTY